jgi:hypothetical protein
MRICGKGDPMRPQARKVYCIILTDILDAEIIYG